MSQSPLPPYSGANAVCAKCDHVGASVEYRDGITCTGPSHEEEAHAHQGGSRPRLCRRCLMCGFAWDEATADPADQRETVAAAAE